MPFLQSSGAISLENVQTTMGGANPISMSEYYRGGSYVPSTKNTSSSSGELYSTSYRWIVPSSLPAQLVWDGSVVANINPGLTSYTSGNATYTRGSYRGQFTDYGVNENYYGITRVLVTVTSINTNIPSSGAISLQQFYGAEKP
jgi:hypothetical protein